jgi:hypothetical protein
MNGMYRTSEPEKPGFLENSRAFGRRLVLVLFLALGTAGVFHLYRTGQAPLIDRAIDVFHVSLITSPPAPPASTQPVDRAFPQPPSSASPQPPTSSSPRQTALTSWSRQNLADFSLEAPFTLTQEAPSTQGLNQIQTRQIVNFLGWTGKAADGFQVGAVFLQIDGTRTLSLEDGVKGVVRHFAARMGDPDPEYRKADAFVNGLPARRISYARGFNAMNQHMEGLVVQANRKIMAAIVIFPGETRMADAQRVLGSMTVRSRY